MHPGRVFYLIGRILLILAAAMLLPLLSALLFRQDDALAFALSAAVTGSLGALLLWLCRGYRRKSMHLRESFLLVSSVWLLAGFCGALPYQFYGCFPDFAGCLFESVSGFTTTGSSALVDIEELPRGLLLWRSMTHWLGGAGIVLLFVALAQKDSSGEAFSLYKAEYSAGAAFSERLAVRIEDNAKLIFYVYLALSLLCTLTLLLCGMDLFDAVNHAMSTVSTGGFSTKNASIAAYDSPVTEWAVGLFLVLSSINFSLFYLLLIRRRWQDVVKEDELRAYLAVVAAATLLITLDLLRNGYYGDQIPTALRQAFFQVAGIISTGGFITDNYDLWPSLSRGILFLLLFAGGCSGSTASGVKFSRWVIGGKAIGQSLSTLIRPDLVSSVRYNGRRLTPELLHRVLVFLLLYLVLSAAGSLLLMISGLPWMEAVAAAVSSIGNVGPGQGATGPAGNYAGLTGFAKIVSSFLMLAGRLEIYTVLALFVPAIWKK